MSVVISDEILRTTRLTAGEMIQELAIALFQREKLTLGQASQLAGLNQWQFQQLFASRQIPLHYDVAEFEADLQTLAGMRQPQPSETSPELEPLPEMFTEED